MRKVLNFFVVILFSFVILNASAFAQATFSPKTDFAAGTQPASSTVCDLNNDGKLDIATVNAGSGTCSFYMNTTAPGASTPSFFAPADLTIALSPQFITNADMNGDGKQDLLIANNINSIWILLNTTVAGTVSPAGVVFKNIE